MKVSSDFKQFKPYFNVYSLINNDQTEKSEILNNFLLRAIETDNLALFTILKYKIILSDFNTITSYLNIRRLDLNFNFRSLILKKNSKLYRIRRYLENVDYSRIEEWNSTPTHSINRANKLGEEALYLGTNELVCLLENNIKKGETYVLGEYTVKEDIELGSFMLFELWYKNDASKVAKLLNAVFIAIDRSEQNSELINLIENVYNKDEKIDILENASSFELPFIFTYLIKDNLFAITNEIADSIREIHNDGILYSSCYLPNKCSNINCSNMNIVLYKDAINKIEFTGYSKKINCYNSDRYESVKQMLNGKLKEEKKSN